MRRFLPAALVVLLLTPARPLAATIEIVGSSAAPTIGGTVSVAGLVSGLASPGAPSIGAFDVDLLFDPLVLAFESVSFVDPVTAVNQLDPPEPGSLGFLGGVFDAGAVVDIFGVSGNSAAVLDAAQAAAFRLFTVTFRVLAAVSTVVALDLLDPSLTFGDADGAPLALTFGRAAVTFSPGSVPEPAAGWLMATGLGWLFAYRARRRARRQ